MWLPRRCPPPLQSPEGLRLVTPGKSRLAEVVLPRLTRERGAESAISFAQSALLEACTLAFEGRRLVGWCLVEESYFSGALITGLFSNVDGLLEPMLLRALRSLWRLECPCVQLEDYRPRWLERLNRLGFDACGDGAADGLLTSEAESFKRMEETSKNQLYWCDLTDREFESSQAEFTPATEPDGRRLVLACAPLVYRVFGDGPGWISRYLEEALLEATVLSFEDEKARAACLVGGFEIPVIWALMVEPHLREKGLGKSLLSQSLSRLKSLGYKAVVAHIRQANLASQATFGSLGFARVTEFEQALPLAEKAGCLRHRDLRLLGLSHKEAVRRCAEARIRLL